MCVVSNIGDDWTGRWPTNPVNPWKLPEAPQPWPYVPYEATPPYIAPVTITLPPEVTKEEFDALKKEMEALKKLLLAAKAYDEATGQPDCEMEEKVDLIKKIAKIVGVDMKDVFGGDHDI